MSLINLKKRFRVMETAGVGEGAEFWDTIGARLGGVSERFMDLVLKTSR